ncbi:hypothetical protein PQX77_002384 [Marasmius sp. AFHP31]|nr:hypothetical protein PQX77_002384 [Marasmius sp. AFHP31]
MVPETSYAPAVEEYLLCLARSERNPDLQGYAVRLSSFIANLCIATLIAWSEKTVKESVNIILLQNFVVLLCTAVAIIRKDLTVADAHFALTLTMSPVGIYLVYSTIFRYLRKRPNHLYSRLGSAKIVTCILTIILAIWWIVFDLLIYFSPIFRDKDCRASLEGWIFYRIIASFFSLLFTVVLLPLLPLFWIIYFIRHFKDIREEYRRHMKNTQRWKRFRWVQSFGRAIKSFTIAQWDVITRSHKWLFFLTILIFYVSWGSALYIWVVDVQEFYHYAVIEALVEDAPPYKPPEDFDVLGYGQLLAVGIAIEPFWAVIKMIYLQRGKVSAWLKQWPGSIWNGIVFIFTGHRNPWKRIQEEQRQRTDDGPDYKHLIHPNFVQVEELPMSTKDSVYEESLDHAPPEGGSKARVLFSRSASPQLVTAYYDPYEPGNGKKNRRSSYDAFL